MRLIFSLMGFILARARGLWLVNVAGLGYLSYDQIYLVRQPVVTFAERSGAKVATERV